MPQLTVLNNSRHAPHRGGISGPGGPISDAALEPLAAGLASVVGENGEVRFGDHDRLLYSTDASLYQVEPLGVVIPGSVSDAANVVRFCAQHAIPMLPRGGGTSLAGQCTNRAVVIDLTPRCRAIRSINIEQRTCEVEPGITIDDLNDALSKRNTGLFFAPDPATTRQCAIGGAIGNNAAGARSILYGRTSENVQSVEVALASCGTGGLLPVTSASETRLWLGPNAGATNPTARRLGAGVLDIVRANAKLIRERFPKTVRRNAGYGLDMILDQLDRGATPETVDLSKLLCGSEGTLAITLAATLKLHPTPKSKGLALLAFDSVDAALEAVGPILTTGPSAVELLDDVVLDAARGNEECRRYLEIMPSNRGPGASPGTLGADSNAQAILYVEYFAFDPTASKQEITAKFAALRHALRYEPSAQAEDNVSTNKSSARAEGSYCTGAVFLTDAPSMAKAWLLRKAGEPLLHGMPGPRKPITFVEDNAVPPERLGEFVRKFREIVTRHGTRAAYWAHASVGVLHVRPMIDIHDPADRERLRAIAVEVADLARSCGGIMSGEHGDGRVRGPLLERFFGAELMRAFADVKRVFDPQGLLNPGNIVGAGPIESITTNLRIQSEPSGVSRRNDSDDAHDVGHAHASRKDQDRRLTPLGSDLYFDYSDSEGFGHAVEQCNGAGVCRKRGGVMCPSFQATLDERHSTRGRGNALRLAITGQFSSRGMGLPPHVSGASPESFVASTHSTHGLESPCHGEPNWCDPETIKTLDLCLSCKACKSECPSNVDISRLKAEYTAQRYKREQRIPLAATLIGNVRVLNRLGALAPDLANWFNNTRPARAIINRVMGVHEKRSMPRFSKSLYRSEPRSVSSRSATRSTSDSHGAPGRRLTPLGSDSVVLFTDCFTTYNESHIGLAAIKVLRTLGYNVQLSGSHCCGRSMISVGMLQQAIETIDTAVESLRPAIKDDTVKAIIVCEPSCLSAMKDDWLALNCRSDKRLREKLAAKAMLPEEFIDKYWDTHPTPPTSDISNLKSDILFHAHCHQKSLWGAESSARLLRRLVGDRLKVLDTGCCGMAGSFGFGKDRYDLSMRIGELSLLPIVREAPVDAIIVATGTSCRHQIHDGAHRSSVHPIELAAQLLA